MKNFICFIILLIFAGFVFLVGWSQIKVKPGYIGVVESKTGGLDKDLIIPGSFSWHKEFLIPGNAEIKKFENKPYNCTKTISGKRLQGRDYSFTFQISLSYLPQVITDLLLENRISSQEDLNEYLDGVAAYLAQRASELYLSRFIQDQAFMPESLTITELTNSIALYKEYPDFDINILALTAYSFSGDSL